MKRYRQGTSKGVGALARLGTGSPTESGKSESGISNRMSLSAMAAALEAENAKLHAEVAMLRQRLCLDEPDSQEIALMVQHKLTRGEAALLTRLMSARPRAVDRYTLEAAIPARDHVNERNVKIVDVLLCKLRKKLGPNVIETLPGVGWRIAPEWKN